MNSYCSTNKEDWIIWLKQNQITLFLTQVRYHFLLIPTLICLLIGCTIETEPVNVLINTDYLEQNEVTIDGVLVECGDTSRRYQKILMKPGVREVSINGVKGKKISIDKKGGLLNLANQEFVLRPIQFQARENMVLASMSLPVIFDSLVVIHKSMLLGTNQEKIIKQLTRFKGSRYQGALPIFIGGEKYGKDELFISKKWQYDVDQEIPFEISVKGGVGTELRIHTQLMEAKKFFLMAQMSKEYDIQRIKDDKLIELVESYVN